METSISLLLGISAVIDSEGKGVIILGECHWGSEVIEDTRSCAIGDFSFQLPRYGYDHGLFLENDAVQVIVPAYRNDK
jgi:hypothetical protein